MIEAKAKVPAKKVPAKKVPAKKEPVRNQVGRPRKDTYRRRELWEARQAARLAVSLWEEKGRPEEVVPVSFSPKDLDKNDQARLNKWFPLMVKKGRPNKWRLGVLAQVIGWDDPVLMVRVLADWEMENGRELGTWWQVLKDVEQDPCTATQEDFIRGQFRQVVTVMRDRAKRFTPEGAEFFLETLWDFHSVWKENQAKRP